MVEPLFLGKVNDWAAFLKLKTKIMKNKNMIIYVGLGVIALPILIGAVCNALTTNYEPLSPQAQKEYSNSSEVLCKRERELANAKLLDIAHGIKIEGDLNVLRDKQYMNCENLNSAAS